MQVSDQYKRIGSLQAVPTTARFEKYSTSWFFKSHMHPSSDSDKVPGPPTAQHPSSNTPHGYQASSVCQCQVKYPPSTCSLNPSDSQRNEGHDARSTEEENCLQVWVKGSGASAVPPTAWGWEAAITDFRRLLAPSVVSMSCVC